PPSNDPADTPSQLSIPQNPEGMSIPRDKAREQSKAAGHDHIWRDSQIGAGEKMWPVGDERSNPRGSGKGQVEKSIEATLAKSETNARSRKASHSLSLFKAATASHETKSREERLKDKQI